MGKTRFPWEEDPNTQPMGSEDPAGDRPELDPEQELASDEGHEDNEDADNPESEVESPEDLRQSFQTLEQLVHEKAKQVDQLLEALDEAKANANVHMRDNEEQDFLNRVRDVYDQDPVTATALMIKRFQEDALNDYDGRMQQQLQNHRMHSRFMDEVLAHPEHADLKPHRAELEFLIRDQGIDPETAAAIVRNIAGKSSSASARREAAARAVRNRSMVENAGEVGEPTKKDADFDRILKKSKTLDEMFHRLSKIRL